MADKNFARSGTAGNDFLADDDPLAELARLVGYEPRPVQPAVSQPVVAPPLVTPIVEPVEPVERHANPVLALEDELMRAFEQYDAPRRHAAVEPVPEPVSHVEPDVEVQEAAEAYAPALSRDEDFREPEPEYDAGLLLADEVESAVDEVPAVEAGHPGHAFAERLEPHFEAPEPLPETVEVGEAGHEPVFFGLQPADEEMPDIGVDLERELELSIGEGFAAAVPAGLDVAAVEASWFEEAPADAEPFVAAEPAYAEAEPQFLAELPQEAPEEHARAMAEAEARWQAEAVEPVFEPEPAYAVEAVVTGDGYGHDELLAEVERFPVPEARSPLSGIVPIDAATPRVTPVFSRATPVASREPVRHDPLPELPVEPVVARAPEPVEAEPEIDFDNFELDLTDIDLDLDPADLMVETFEETAEAEKPEPAVAVPVSAYTAPQPVAAEPADGVLPFDPTMIAETDEGVTPVTELDVPQLPVIEKEKPPVHHADYDFDIDAEMAQLFAAPEGKPAAEEAISAAHPAARIAEVDDFERALEEDFRRSLSEPERMAIPVDPGQDGGLYAGDGYDEARPPARRGLLIAASLAGLLLVGGGGVYAWMSLGDGVAGSGEPRVILADREPVKVVPEERGGKSVPNQDKAVYDRVAGNTDATPQQDQLVTTTEEPVDVVQRTLTPETLPFDGPADEEGLAARDDDEGRLLPGVDEPATAEDGRAPLVSPRKVKTMIVKPDGTLVAREVDAPETEVAAAETARIDAEATATTGGAAAEAVATVEETARLAADADASLRAEQEAAEAEPRSALAEVAGIEVEDTAPVRVVKTTTVGRTDGNAPVPEMRPIDQPVNVVGTVTENGNLAATPTAEATTTATTTAAAETQVAAVSPGGYVIQIASLPSEAEAQKSYNTLSAKFASVIGGRGVDIRRAEIPNKGTYYRVRIPAGSRDEANSLCNRYKSAGGSCLVTR